jgi:glycosyltransferase involved in cell wall biosynthesis
VRTAWEVRGVPSALVRTLGRFEQVWAMSSFSRDVLVEAGADPERLGVWPPTLARAPDAAGVRRLRAERMPEGKVLGVLAWDGRKNPAALLRAFARARSIAGGGTLTLKVRGVEPATAERFVAEVLAGEPAAAAAVRLVVGDLEEDSLWGLYLDADVYCVPTRGEGFGLPFLEAMAAGCAVVAPEEGGHREAVNDAQWLVPGEWVPVVASEAPVFRGGTWFEVNEEALAAALAEAIANPADTRQRGLAALERAEELLRAPMPSEVLALLEGAAGGELSAR